MRDRLTIIVGLIFIAACALVTFAKIESHYSPPDAPAQLPSPAPLLPTATSAAAAASPAPPPTPTPTHTVTVWTTVPASTGSEDGH
jgi:hypothetical protein